MQKIILFRISSKGYPKVKVDGINKYDSLKNLTKNFQGWKFICVADNCDEELIAHIKTNYQFDQLIETQLGNPGSFWKIYEIALDMAKDDDIFYFIEDDYLHLPEAPIALEEGLHYFDYVTLYDHPDKYNLHHGPINPYAKKNRYSELTEVVAGPNHWWRTSNSTTMTFAVTGKTLKADADIWSITKTAKQDFDFDNFCILTKQPMMAKSSHIKQISRRLQFWSKPKRYLGISIPGLALHLEKAFLGKSDEVRFSLPPQNFEVKQNRVQGIIKPKLLDVFLFYNELDLLKARLEYLGPTVDHFIISEANVDFSGRPKDFLLNQELVNTLPFASKIIYHREYINLNAITWLFKKLKYRNRITRFLWKIQDAQRNSTLTPLRSFSPNDIIIFSDLDEFPSETAIEEGVNKLRRIEPNHPEPHAYSLNQTFYYYNLNNAAYEEKFYGSVMTTLGAFRNHLPHRFRSGKNDFEHIASGGWHFSYFMDEKKILNKIYAISDVENLSAYKNITTEEIQQKILSGSDLYDRGIRLNKLEYNKIPSSVIKVIQKYLPNCTKIT